MFRGREKLAPVTCRRRRMDTQGKLEMLSDASRYDLSCASCTAKDDHRVRGEGGRWLYPVSLPSGGKSLMLKTLLSNVCVNRCLYCPFRNSMDVPRCTLSPEEIVSVFLGYVRRLNIHGLFLSSGVIRDADHTMERMLAVAGLLRRRYQYRGYIHLKVIPGASDAAIEEALSLASAVSLNVEAPNRNAFEKLSPTKNFERDIVGGIKKISELTAPGSRFSRVHQTTQFIVGAAGEKDADIVNATFGLYRRLRLDRVYYSAYQRGLGDPNLPGEKIQPAVVTKAIGMFDAVESTDPAAQGDPYGPDLLTREHRLYQVDWLMRKYGFDADEIPFEPDGNLSLQADPKTLWARRNPQFFPLNVNKADRRELLRVPGLGPVGVKRILTLRAGGGKLRSARDLAGVAPRLNRAEKYLKFA